MLGQIEGRSSEMAVRTALGATRTRLTQQIIVEALMIGVCAAIAGGALAAAGFGLLAHALRSAPGARARNSTGRCLPLRWSWRSARRCSSCSLQQFRSGAATCTARSAALAGGIVRRGSRLEQGLVVTEVALAMLIASGSALLVRSVMNLYAVNPGVDTGASP
jgi:ABC-type antimicrobial peptide transport system permease subunit